MQKLKQKIAKNSKKFWAAIISCVMVISLGVGLGVGLSGRAKNASTNTTPSDTTGASATSWSTSELWDESNQKFNLSSAGALLDAITADYDVFGTGSLNENIFQDHSSDKITLGSLQWLPTHLSRDNDNNAVLTLWLAEYSMPFYDKIMEKTHRGEEYEYEDYYQDGLWFDNFYTSEMCLGSDYLDDIYFQNDGDEGQYFEGLWDLADQAGVDEIDYCREHVKSQGYATFTSYMDVGSAIDAYGSEGLMTFFDSHNSDYIFFPYLYGASVVRSGTLNNGGTFYTDCSSIDSSEYVGQSPTSVFAPFTMSEFGLTKFLDTPRQIDWQNDDKYYWFYDDVSCEYELNVNSTLDKDSFYIYDNITGGQFTDSDYCLTGLNYDLYDAWGDDYVWLPSYDELYIWGVGESSTESMINVPQLEPSPYGGNPDYEYLYTNSALTRSYFIEYNDPRYGATTGLGVLDYDGTLGIYNVADYPADYGFVIRPCIHLNLTQVASNINYIDFTKLNKGTSSDPYKITSKDDLARFSELVNSGNNFSGKFLRQTANINLGGSNWTPIGTSSNPFAGHYAGNGYKIQNLTINSTSRYQGLFGNVVGASSSNRAEITNVTLLGGSISGGTYTAGIAGSCKYADITNCKNTIYINGDYCSAGIVGSFNSGTIQGCENTATINSTGDEIGGIAGYVDAGTIKNCINTGNVTLGNGDNNGGTAGIVGHSSRYGTKVIENCTNSGNISTSSACVGGIGGQFFGTITNCTNRGNVSGKEAVGGLAGIYTGQMSNCISSGNVTCSNDYLGGLIGAIASDAALIATISNCSATGYINAPISASEIGGLFGEVNNAPTITACSFYGSSLKALKMYGAVNDGKPLTLACWSWCNDVKQISEDVTSAWTEYWAIIENIGGIGVGANMPTNVVISNVPTSLRSSVETLKRFFDSTFVKYSA